MADPRKDKTNMIHPKYVVSALIPMWVLTNWNVDLQVICTILISLNTCDRLMYPSSYNPAASARDHWLYSPFTGRTLATLAEYHMYWVWATWVYQPYCGSTLGNIVVFGEVICWIGLVFQSKFVHWCEDATWMVHASIMCYHSQTLMQCVIYGVFALYMVLIHLPRMFNGIETIIDCRRFPGVLIKVPDMTTKAWMVPVLLSMPILQAYIYFDINN